MYIICLWPPNTQNKSDNKTIEYWFLGYVDRVKGYRFQAKLTHQIIISRNVVFQKDDYKSKVPHHEIPLWVLGLAEILEYWKRHGGFQRLDKMATTMTKQTFDQSEPFPHKSRVTIVDK
jgi:hypothetical protein